MLYLDTSFLAPLVRPETTSTRVERFVMGLPPRELAISHLVRVEFSSLLGREVRMGGINSKAAKSADAYFETIVRASFVVLLPNSADFDLAKEYLAHHASGLQAGDALHLAVANNHRAEAIYTLDKGLLRAGRMLGLPVNMGIRLRGFEN